MATYDECHEGHTKDYYEEKWSQGCVEVHWWPPGDSSKEMTSELKPEGQDEAARKRMRHCKSHGKNKGRVIFKINCLG